MRAIARSGSTYVLIQEDDVSLVNQEPRAAGRVFEADRGYLSAPRNVHSLLKFGNWQAVDLDDAATRELLKSATTIVGPEVDESWALPALGQNRTQRRQRAA